MFTKQQEFIKLKDEDWLVKQKHAGLCVARILNGFRKIVEDKTPNVSLKDLEAHALERMKSMDCTPTFLNYGTPPFPSAVCTSVNEKLVHGVVTDYVLQDGDVVSMDLGATFEGVIADAAYTCIYGEPKSKEIVRMLDICYGSLLAGINAAKVGNRIGSIGKAIHAYTKDSGFSLIDHYGGHGIDLNVPHAPPFVSNRALSNEGVRIQSGMTIAIEPMLVMGDKKTHVSSEDNWTVIASGISCHFEHSIYIDKNISYILTKE